MPDRDGKRTGTSRHSYTEIAPIEKIVYSARKVPFLARLREKDGVYYWPN